jgi:transcriptional regulator with XRE-family HTH domain
MGTGEFVMTRVAGHTDGFALLLKELRVTARMTQEGLAERAGISVRTVRDIERGRVRFPRPETARLLSSALALSGPSLAQFLRLARAGYWAGRIGELRSRSAKPSADGL